MFSTIRPMIALFVSVTLCLSVVQGDVIFNVSLDGQQEVPPNASPGSGSAVAIFNELTGAMSITGSFGGLTSGVTAAHLHGYSAVGVNSGVLIPLSVIGIGATSGTFSGNGVIPFADIQKVMDGLTYINVHTSTFPGGEIRGQLMDPVPEPGSVLLTLVAGCGGLTLRLRRQAY